MIRRWIAQLRLRPLLDLLSLLVALVPLSGFLLVAVTVLARSAKQKDLPGALIPLFAGHSKGWASHGLEAT